MKNNFLIKLSSLVLAFLITASALSVGTLVNAATTTKVEKSYEIAVVFDNSGSMYDNQAWCRAKYAMEIFSSMLNYENGDKLKIFTMWEITTDGSKPDSGGSYSVEINNKDDIDKISNLYTVKPSYTPFAPVTEAFNYLKTSKATEKWLIVLTDGEFNQNERGKKEDINLQNKLSALASDEIKVQYLGFGEATNLTADEAKGFFTKKSSDTSLKDDLIDICNSIFQRSVLPSNRLSGTKLNIDLSMKNLIVFAQGSNAKITSLTDESGNEIKITLDSGQRKFSTIKAKGHDDAPVDKSLAGQVVTFAECPKGNYTLNCSGADAIQIFYEPDIDIKITLTNSEGETVDPSSGEILAGEYTINSTIVDRNTGEDVLNHELMGNDVKLTTFVSTSSSEEYAEYKNGSKINFEPDSSTEVYVEGTYLKKFKITTKGDPNAFPVSLNIIPPPVELNIKTEVLQKDNWYKLSDHEEWEPVKATLSIDGQPLTKEQMSSVKLDVKSDKLACRYEPVPDESAYLIYIAQDESGKYVEPSKGRHKLNVSATFVDEYGKETKKSDNVSFEIQNYSKIWRILIWIVGILILLALWLAFMMQKVMPKEMKKDSASFFAMSAGDVDPSFVKVDYRRKGKTLTVSGPSTVDYDEQCSATFALKPVDNRFTQSKRRRVAVTGIDSNCEEMKVAGTTYINYEGQWVKKTMLKAAEDGRPIPPVDQQFSSCNPRFELFREGGKASLTCKTKTTK